MNLLRKFLRLTENAESLDLGNIVFSPYRTDGVPTNEMNTETEQKLFFSLNRWINSWERLKKPEIDIIKKLIASEKYGDIFKEPAKGTILYRGLNSISSEVLIDLLNLSSEKDIPSNGACDGNWVMRPKNGQTIDSYTTDFQVAEIFSAGKYTTPRKGTYKVIIEANVDNNQGVFFDLDHIMSKLGSEFDVFRESEVVSLEPVNVSKISWKLVS